jgi:hypothetical protein
MRDPPPLRVDLAPSRLRRAFIAASFGATACLCASLPLDGWLRGWTVLLVAALAARAWRADTPAALIVRLDGSLALLARDGTSTKAALMNGGYLGTRLVSIVYRPLGRRRCGVVTILPDMLPADDLRRLRVRLGYSRSDDDAGLPASQARASTSAPLSAFRWRPMRSR